MDSNIPIVEPDPGDILQNRDNRYLQDPRRVCDYLAKIPEDNLNNHPEQMMPNHNDEGAS